ncbi:MAG TPA: TetR/AcrR family transcriptional regulator [Syntrophorhabdaceae bacterium]|nr:TetR/AcrR family transcriptional regulator [Syntrophorhabdaceae bacterium]
MARTADKGDKLSKETAKKLIEVAIDLFSRKGFQGTSIRDIASEMGMTSSNIYHYFGTKEGVLRAIERQTLEPIIKEFRYIASVDKPPLERFSMLVKAHLTYLDAHRKESLIFSTLNEEVFPSDRKERDLNKKFQTETFFIYRSEIERVLSSMGKSGNSTVAAFSTLGSIIWFLRWYRPQGENTFEEVANSIIKYILYGIIGNGSSEFPTINNT